MDVDYPSGGSSLTVEIQGVSAKGGAMKRAREFAGLGGDIRRVGSVIRRGKKTARIRLTTASFRRP